MTAGLFATVLEPWSRRRAWGLLVAVVLLGMVLRAMAVVALGSPLESDELAYHSMATSLLGGQGVVDFMGNRAMYNVGYPLFVIVPLFAVVGDSVVALQALQVALGGLTVVLVYALVRAVDAGRGAAVLAAAAWAFYVPAMTMAESVLKENLQVPLMVGLLIALLRLARASGWWPAVAVGFAFGLLALVGNSALSLALAVPVALWLAWNRQHEVSTSAVAPTHAAFGHAVLIAVVAAAIAAPWMWRNAQQIGAPVLNTNGGFNLYLGNNPAATGRFVSIADTPVAPRWEALRREGEVLASETLRQEALAWVRANPGRFFELVVQKAVWFWSPPESKHGVGRVEALVRWVWSAQFVVLAALAAVGTLLLWRHLPRGIWVLWAGVLGYWVAHLPFYVLTRYREPVMPLVAAIAAIVLVSAAAAWRRRAAPAAARRGLSSSP
ncbi:MAG: hypothetical protein ING89_06050 [Rubrivivax sp.]|nr:hypothetical protein [Rubrivivax sp.]